MDNGEILQQFIAMTGAETDFALSFLEANAWDLESAINLYLEGNYGASGGAATPAMAAGGAGEMYSPDMPSPSFSSPIFPSPALNTFKTNKPTNEQGLGGEVDPRTRADEELARAMSDIPPEAFDDDNAAMYDEGVRAPIMPKSEVLVEDDPYIRPIRFRPPRGEANVFDMFRDYRQESMVSRGGEDQNSKKIKTLADLFRPPVDLLEPGSFDNVKNVANHRKKWLLVNIQEVSEFDCQKLNRDTWSDPAVKSMIKSNFVLWQVLKTSEEGQRYCRYYPIDIVPHLAIVDSRTGERLDVREGFIEPKDLVIWLESFVSTNSLEDTGVKIQPRAESPKRIGDLSEEVQLAAAVAASLGQDLSQTETPPSTTTSTSTSTTTTSTPAPTLAPAPAPTPVVEPVSHGAEEPPAALLAEHSNQSADCNCVIQVRMPQSEPIKGFFRPTDTLRTVHQYVSLHMNPKKEFVLVTTFPKKTYSGDQLNLTLKEADLVPRAVLICEIP